MRNRLMLLSLLAVLLVRVGAWAQQTDAREPLLGTWANGEYMKGIFDWRFVYQADGSAQFWTEGKSAEQPYNWEGRYSIEKEWRDSDGNVWYRVLLRMNFAPFSEVGAKTRYNLVKIASTGDVLELERSTIDFPQQFGTPGVRHYVYHRE